MTEKELAAYYNKYYEKMVLYGTRFINRIDVVQDIVIDVFLEGYNNYIERGAAGGFGAYLVRGVRYRSFDFLKAEKRHKMHNIKISLLPVSDDPTLVLVDGQVIQFIRDAIESLTPAEKEVINSTLHGEESSRIANRRKSSRQTVLNIKSQAIAKLRTLVNKKFNPS